MSKEKKKFPLEVNGTKKKWKQKTKKEEEEILNRKMLNNWTVAQPNIESDNNNDSDDDNEREKRIERNNDMNEKPWVIFVNIDVNQFEWNWNSFCGSVQV